ncbi:MAG: GNAT family N-acetyltransferase [Anaerolineae bacterium]|nr:GNAT family N-acetyltransferase [Anaerolineae bacterium]
MDFFNMDSAVMRSFVPEITRPYAPSDIVIRPGEPGDVDLILAMHGRLSDESLYKRYHAPRRPTQAEVARMCTLNGENGRLLVAVIPGRRPQIVGMAYYILTGDSADTAFLVEDSFQGMGIGKQLVRALVHQAIAQGVHYFDAHVLPSNRSMIHLLLQAGQLVYNKLDFGARDLRVEIEG